MKKQLILGAAIVAMVLSFSVSAMADGNNTKIGLGVSHGGDANNIYVPIKMKDDLWIEPYVQFHNADHGNDIIGLGTGVFVNMKKTQHTQAYFGGRIGFANVSPEKITGVPGSGDSYTLFHLAGVVGFGYLPVDNVMFGAEAALALDDSDDNTTLGTQTGLFVRYFFQ